MLTTPLSWSGMLTGWRGWRHWLLSANLSRIWWQHAENISCVHSLKIWAIFDGLVWLSCTPSEASFQDWVQLICAGFHRDRNFEPHAHWCYVSSLEDSPRHFSRHIHNIRSLFTWNVTKNGNIHVLINEFMDEDKFLAVMDDFEITLSTALNQGWPSKLLQFWI